MQKSELGFKFACLGFKVCFLKKFLDRSASFFGQETHEHIKTIKKMSGGMSGSLLFNSLLKGYRGAQQQQQRFFKRGGVPPRAAAAAPSPGGKYPPTLLQGARGEYPSATTAAAACSAAGGRYPPRGCCSSEGGYPPRAAAIASAFRPGGGYPPSLLQQQRGGGPPPAGATGHVLAIRHRMPSLKPWVGIVGNLRITSSA